MGRVSVPSARLGRGSGFTLIELLVVILIIGVLVAVSAPSFLGQTQKAHDSAAKQELTVAYREAVAIGTDHEGRYVDGSFDVSALASAIEQSEPELDVVAGSCPQDATSDPAHVVVDSSTTANHLVLCNDPTHTVWTLTAAYPGPPSFSSQQVSGSGPAVTLPPANQSPPIVSGTARVGETLSATEGVWTHSPTGYAYQWQTSTNSTAWTDLAGASAADYTIQPGDAGEYLRVSVTASNTAGQDVTASAATAKVVPPAPVEQSAPTVSGTYASGQVLTATSGGWTGTPTSYGYQWQRSADGSSWADVATATAQTYTINSADSGDYLRVEVTATNAGGSSTPAASATPSAKVDNYAAAVVASGPIVYYRLGESATTSVVKDEMGYQDGSFTNPTVTVGTIGALSGDGNTAVTFLGGTNASVTVASHPALSPSNDMTVALWVKPGSSQTANADMIGNMYGSTCCSGWSLETPVGGATNYFDFEWGNGSNATDNGSASGVQLTAGVWQQLVVVKSGTSVSYYKNGSLAATSTGSFSAIGASPANLFLGNSACCNRVFNGALDEVAVYGKALTQAQIERLYSIGAGGSAAPYDTALPTISGTLAAGQNVTASTGSWLGSPSGYAYQWQVSPDGTSWTAASGAGAQTASYTVAAADVGQRLRVAVTATNAYGSASASSAATGVVASAYDGRVAADGASHYWKFDDASGSSLSASIGSGAFAYYGGYTLAQPSLLPSGLGSSAKLNGSSGYLSSGTTFFPGSASATWTAEIWIEPTVISTSHSNVIFAQYGNSDGSSSGRMFAYVSQTGHVGMQIGSTSLTDSTVTLAVNTPYMIDISRNGSTISIYVNGALVASGANSSALYQEGTRIGTDENTSNPYFNGYFDDFSLYPTALSATQIAAHYSAASS